MTASGDRPGQIVIDAGPLIALFYLRDSEHLSATRGFSQLHETRTVVIAPLPIVFEVYKWLGSRVGPAHARRGLGAMRSTLDIRYPAPGDLEELVGLIERMPTWPGSLEDALVAILCLRLDVPIWTFNYRDLAVFPNLRFWNPA